MIQGVGMRIGIDGGCLSNRRGFGRFAREILAALGRLELKHEILVFVDRPSLDDAAVTIPEGFVTVPVEVKEAPSRAASALGRRRLSDLLAMGRAAARQRLDILYFPSSYSFFPVWNVDKVVVTIFDTLALAHPDLVFPTWKGHWLWTLKERAAVLRADRLLTTSKASRDDLIQWYHLDPSRVGLITAGPDPCFKPGGCGPSSDRVLIEYGLTPGDRYLLYVGGLSPHKNLPRLIEAFGKSAPSNVKLVIVGDHADVFYTHLPEIKSTIQRIGISGQVLFTGFVPDEKLVHLYSRSYALVQPSLLEGFGLPPVEAMACGIPVLCSQTGSLPEVVGNGGLFFDPTDIRSMAAVVSSVLSNPSRRDRLADQALSRSRLFTWERSARDLIETFESLSSTSPRHGIRPCTRKRHLPLRPQTPHGDNVKRL